MVRLVRHRYKERPAIGEELNMLIVEQFRKCVTFMLLDVPDNQTGTVRRIPAATAFFVSVPIGDEYPVVYAVTARHVIYRSRPYGPIYIRINAADGTFQDIQVAQDSWVAHPSTDVAVTRVTLPFEGFDLKAIPLSMLATDEYVAQRNIREGDEVFFVGLFSQFPGRERNQPIIRFGNISLMPREKVPARLNPDSDAMTLIDAYLIEARSWGGHSGSPAFIYFPSDREPGQFMIGIGVQRTALLGLVHGHYEIEQDVAFIGDILGSGKVPLNAGVAMVVPAQEIIDTLMQEELVQERNKIVEQVRKRGSAPKADAGLTEPPEA
jgi:hypothetical protein